MSKQSVVAILAALLSGCVTHIQPTVQSNPPPSRPFKEFEAFEVRPLAAAATVQEPEAMKKIQEYLNSKFKPLTQQWTRGARSGGDTLVIEPYVHELKFVSGTNRVFAGSMAGSSAVRMTLKLTDKTTGEVIGQPEFYQRAAAMGGAYSFGSTDNQMLERICTVAEQYLQRNHEQAVGGPTGFEEP